MTPTITLEIATRDNMSEPLIWSSPVSLEEIVDKGTAFFFRRLGVGKFIRFRLTVSNTTEVSVDELYILSLIMVSMTEDDDVE